MTFLYILSGIAILQGLITLMEGIRWARFMRAGGLAKPVLVSGPSVVVFCPCKGIDPDFEKNVRSILDQDYSNFKVQFVVESENDEAYRALSAIGATNILVAGEAIDCGQKVHNLLAAVYHTGATADIYVFCDSDARFPRHWLSSLTVPLSDPAVCVTQATGGISFEAEAFRRCYAPPGTRAS